MSSDPTAPVTKRLTAKRFAGIPELEAAFTDFSDASDISDGDGVQPPHQGEFVKLLQQSLMDMGYPLSHGANGIYTSETRRAVTELQVDAGHPLHAGHEWEHIGGIGGPNTLAHFDMFDPGGTVGSHALRSTGVAANVVRFIESADHPFAGFDATTTPVSLVVGVATRRRVKIETEPSGADVEFSVVDPSVAEIGRTLEGIVVGGRGPGKTTVEARSGGRLLGRMEVFVKSMRREDVNFFLVRGAGPLASERTHEQAKYLTLRLNRVWRRQANVIFKMKRVEDVEIAAISDLAKFAVPGAFNVVCVGSAAGTPPAGIALFPDRDCADKMDIANAAGRYLGFSGAGASTGLMAGCGQGAERRRVSRMLADVVNP
jgi:hypothetical protein